jgi:amphi-Trp domain-containing protein
MERSEVAKYLRSLADRIEQNRVVLTEGDEEYPLDLPDELELEVEHTEKEKKGSTRYQLELELKWGGAAGGPGLA